MKQAKLIVDIDEIRLKDEAEDETVQSALKREFGWLEQSGVFLDRIYAFSNLKLSLGFYKQELGDITATNGITAGDHSTAFEMIFHMFKGSNVGKRCFRNMVGSFEPVAEKDIELAILLNEASKSVDIWVKGVKESRHMTNYDYREYDEHNLYRVYKVTIDAFDCKTNYPDYEHIMDTVYGLYEEVNQFGDTTELCPYCEEEVDLPNKLAIQECPSCHKMIKTCSMCEDKPCDDCPLGSDSADLLN
jgi:hypothetical protein